MKRFAILMNLIMVAALVFCIVQINDLENQINNLRNSINNVDRNLSYQMSDIYNNVHSMLEEEVNQLTMSDWEYGEIDIANETAEIICTVVPKEYNPDATSVKLISKHQEVLMEYADGKYTAKMNLPLFGISEIEQVNLIDNGIIRTQQLGWSISPKDQAMLWTFTRFSGEGRGTYGKESYTWKPNGHIHINIEKKGTFEIKKIDVVEMMDGKEISRTAVDITPEGQKAYAEKISKQGYAVPESVVSLEQAETSTCNGFAEFFYPFSKEIVVPNGSEYILYVDITDEYDLTYRCVADFVSMEENGDRNEGRENELHMLVNAQAIMIFNKDGRLVYESEFMKEMDFHH